MKRGIFYLLLFVLSAINVHAQQISVNQTTTLDQLPSNTVFRIFQDNDGFIWYGTLDGLCRYDGYRVLVFRSDLNNPQLLSNNEITCIAEDKNKRLWVGTKQGLNILDKKTYGITHFEGEGISKREIKCITVSANGKIWVGTNNYVACYNPDLTLHKIYNSSLPLAGVNSIYEDPQGDLWVTLWRNGLHKYDKEKDSFVSYPFIGTGNNPFKIFQDNKKQYWICTWGNGVYLFNPDDELNVYTPIKIGSETESTFFSIVQDERYGYIWLMSFLGIYAMEYKDSTLQSVDVSRLFKEHNNIFSEIVKDKVGNLWIATFGEGVFTINFDKPVIENHSLPSIKDKTGITANITAIYIDKDNDIWINQNRWGLAVFSPAENSVRFFNDFPALQNITDFVVMKADFGIVKCISGFRSIPDEVWAGPENNSIIYALKKSKQDIVVNRKINLADIAEEPGNLHLFYEDRKNNIWIATTNKLFIKPYNKDSIEHIACELNNITGITEDTRGLVWVSTKNTGIYQIMTTAGKNALNHQITNYNKENSTLPSNNIEAVCADFNGNVWIGSKEGNFIVYDIVKQTFNDLSGLFNTLGAGILNIVVDDFSHVWVSTNKRIIEYNPQNGASREYTNSDGVLVNSFLVDSYYKDKSGRILFGGNKGISAFTPSEKLSENPAAVKTFISDIKIGSKSVFQGNDNENFDIIAQNIKLKPRDRNIEIHFSSLNYSFPSKIRYAYKMEGIDNDWVHVEDDRQFAIYNQLGKGSHTFYVKATDENRLWSSNITQLKIYKSPAFYETWWAYAIYAILTLACINFAYNTIKNRIRLRNELKIAQIEKDKSEELTQTKLRYFTNISHDFLTPLTILSCLIDDVEVSHKNKITQFDPMRSNITRLRRLLQQVLDFRKMESGNMKLKISNGEIVNFIKSVCYTIFLPLVKKKNISLEFSSNISEVQAYFDADKIDKVVFNLLSNAFKYTPKNGTIKVELEKFDVKDHSYLDVRVSDTGAGIEPDDLKNIFTRFYTNKMGEAGNSNGIGLSLTKDLLELHHGTISVESEVNIGTTFTISVPIDKDSYNVAELHKSEQIIIQKQNEPEVPEAGSYNDYGDSNDNSDNDIVNSSSPTNVLIVEDNEELLHLMHNILSKHYHVFTAINGSMAVELINKDNNIDIIISDVMMPEMDGLELCRAVKKNIETSHIPVILLTAKNSAEDRIECYNAGADGYISKPFELKVLVARINNFLSTKKDKQKEFKKDVEINISTLEYPSIDEQFLDNAIKIIETQLSDNQLDVNTFAESLNMSKSSLYRKIKTMTGLSPNEFIRNIRLKHACQMLKNKSISISEVAYSVGFSDPKYFTLCFKGEFNVTPREYQKSS